MASVDDIFIELKQLSAQLWRGTSPRPGVVLNGMVPRTQELVTLIQSEVTETRSFLQAINEQTLGRIENEIKATRQLMDTLEGGFLDAVSAANAKLVDQFASLMRDDLTELQAGQDGLRELVIKDADLLAKLEGVTASIQSDVTGLHAKLDGLKADLDALP